MNKNYRKNTIVELFDKIIKIKIRKNNLAEDLMKYLKPGALSFFLEYLTGLDSVSVDRKYRKFLINRDVIWFKKLISKYNTKRINNALFFMMKSLNRKEIPSMYEVDPSGKYYLLNIPVEFVKQESLVEIIKPLIKNVLKEFLF